MPSNGPHRRHQLPVTGATTCMHVSTVLLDLTCYAEAKYLTVVHRCFPLESYTLLHRCPSVTDRQSMVLVHTVARMTQSKAESVLATLTLEEKVRSAFKYATAITNIRSRSHYSPALTSGKPLPSLRKVSLHLR